MKKIVLGRLVIVVLVLGIFGVAYAVRGDLTNFNTRYGTAGTVLDQCILCHTTNTQVGPLNSYGNTLAGNGKNYAAAESIDSDGDGFSNIAEITARTFPGNAASRPATTDTTPPTVSSFTIPSTSSSLTVPITAFTATDNVGVTGYRITESATAPSASAAGWSATAPTSYTFATAGAKTLYAWAKDAANNVSTSRSASVTITTDSSNRLTDFNRDGISDLVGLTSTGLIYYTTNLSTWTQIPGALEQLVVGDFNNDGISDLAGLTSNGLIYYTTNRSTCTQIPGALWELAQ